MKEVSAILGQCHYSHTILKPNILADISEGFLLLYLQVKDAKP